MRDHLANQALVTELIYMNNDWIGATMLTTQQKPEAETTSPGFLQDHNYCQSHMFC